MRYEQIRLEKRGPVAPSPHDQGAPRRECLHDRSHPRRTLETDALKECWTTPEHREAVDVFLSKRKPDFEKVAS
jgi:hypothetical protein